MELYSFLLKKNTTVIGDTLFFKFPSPYGVSFIIILKKSVYEQIKWAMFPSPYGVIFILTFKTCNSECIYRIRFRLLTELYSFLLT